MEFYEGSGHDRKVSITTLLLVLVAGIGAGIRRIRGRRVLADLLSCCCWRFGIPPVLSNRHEHGGRMRHRHRQPALRPQGLKGQGRRAAVYACIGLVGGIIGGLLLLELPARSSEFAVPPLSCSARFIIALST